jgi:hypothetical protein
MKGILRVMAYGIVTVCWAVATRELSAELRVESSEQLSYLVEGMEASLNRIETIQADLTSMEIYEVTGRPRVDIITKTGWISKGARHKFETQLTQLYDGELPPEPVPDQKNAPVGERFTESAYSGEVFVEFRPASKKAIVREWKNSPAGTLQERAYHEPHFYGTTIKGLSLSDIVIKGQYWHALPENAERLIRWAGKREYKGRQAEVVEMSVKWTSSNGTRNEQRYNILVEPDRSFTVPFISIAYAQDDHPLEIFETVETECVDYGDNLWAAKKTEVIDSFTTNGKAGKSRTVITVDGIKFNVPVTDDELKVNLVDGTRVDDQIVVIFYTYGIGNEEDVLKALEKTLRQENLGTTIPIGEKALSETEIKPQPTEQSRLSLQGEDQYRGTDLQYKGKGWLLALLTGSGLGVIILIGCVVYWLDVRKQRRMS